MSTDRPSPTVRILAPDERLRHKVHSPAGLAPDTMISRAATAIDAMRDGYRHRLAEKIGAISDLLQMPGIADPVGGAPLRAQTYRLAHDIKGTAGTFGFALASAVAGSLCRVLADGTVGEALYSAVLGAHRDALELIAQAVIARDDAGLDGPSASQLLGGLTRAAARVSQPPVPAMAAPQ